MAKNLKKSGKKSKQKATTAFHAVSQDGVHHVVGIEELRVVLVPDGDGWFAQGLEVDYAAQGCTEEEVKKNFQEGLETSVEAHLKIYGNIDGLLNAAPPAVWKEMLYDPQAKKKIYSQVTSHFLQRVSPFGQYKFMVAAAA